MHLIIKVTSSQACLQQGKEREGEEEEGKGGEEDGGKGRLDS